MSTERSERLEEARQRMAHISDLVRRLAPYGLRSKPIISATFAPLGLHLASIVVSDGGLDEVSYLVTHQASRFVIAMSQTKGSALSMAREFIAEVGHARICEWAARYEADRQRAQMSHEAQREEERQAAKSARSVVRSISRRRREIFDKSNGKCHYCETALTLDGKWHVEHKLPKALGGDNHPDNLTAACVSCNLQKRDLTDVEFKAKKATP